MRLCAALGELLGFNVDAVAADMLRPEILESALRDAVALCFDTARGDRDGRLRRAPLRATLRTG